MRFYFDILREYRKQIRAEKWSLLETLGESTQDLYYRFKLCLTMDDIVHVMDLLEKDKESSSKDLCLLTEYMEDLLSNCLANIEWTEEHQKELLSLQPHIERHQLLSFMQILLENASVIGVEKVAIITQRITSLLQSKDVSQTLTQEELDVVFGSLSSQ